MKNKTINIKADHTGGGNLMAVSCQKENVMDFAPETAVSEVGTVYTVQYAVNGVLHSESFQNEEDVDALRMRLMTLAREGYDVMFFDNNYNPNALSTKEAGRWIDNK